jgi:hypothetical protein
MLERTKKQIIFKTLNLWKEGWMEHVWMKW